MNNFGESVSYDKTGVSIEDCRITVFFLLMSGVKSDNNSLKTSLETHVFIICEAGKIFGTLENYRNGTEGIITLY